MHKDSLHARFSQLKHLLLFFEPCMLKYKTSNYNGCLPPLYLKHSTAWQVVALPILANTLQRHNTENSKQRFLEKELRGYSPKSYIHVSVSDLYIS
jgi:hypothetical protein